MSNFLAVSLVSLLLASATPALAESKLTTTVYTGSAVGFLANSTLVGAAPAARRNAAAAASSCPVRNSSAPS